MVSNFALCGIPFLAGFYSRDFILEIFSMRYVNIFGFFFCVYGFDGLFNNLQVGTTKSSFMPILKLTIQKDK